MKLLETYEGSGLAAVAAAAAHAAGSATPWCPAMAVIQSPASIVATAARQSTIEPAAAARPVVIAQSPAPVMTEANRQAAIEDLRLPGTDAAIASAKADPSVTPSMAAPRVLTAYKAHLGIASAVIAVASAAPTAPVNMAQLPDHARAEWRESPALQAEFPAVETYVALRKAEVSGRVRVYGAEAPRTSLPPNAPNFAKLADSWRSEWASSPALQRDFATGDAYANYAKAVAQGRVRVVGQRFS